MGEHDRWTQSAAQLPTLAIVEEDWATALGTQRALCAAGSHRIVGIPDPLHAAAARAGYTIVHRDHNFDLIAEVSGQPTQWVVDRGTID